MTKDINHTVKAVIYSKDKILLQLRDQKPNIFYPGVWGLFGGGMDDGEKPIDALKRELLEEIGFEIDEIIQYLDEIRLTKAYLKHQVKEMKLL